MSIHLEGREMDNNSRKVWLRKIRLYWPSKGNNFGLSDTQEPHRRSAGDAERERHQIHIYEGLECPDVTPRCIPCLRATPVRIEFSSLKICS